MWRRCLQQHSYNEYLVLKSRETRGGNTETDGSVPRCGDKVVDLWSVLGTDSSVPEFSSRESRGVEWR